jgi:hypothetical protein
MLDRIRFDQGGDAGAAERVLQGIDGVGQGHCRRAGRRSGDGRHGQAGRVGCGDVLNRVFGEPAHRLLNGGCGGE